MINVNLCLHLVYQVAKTIDTIIAREINAFLSKCIETVTKPDCRFSVTKIYKDHENIENAIFSHVYYSFCLEYF